MILIDSGPLLALIDAGDEAHLNCTRIALTLRRVPLITTWPCFTETMYLAGRQGGHKLQDALWRLRKDDVLRIHHTTSEEADRMEELMRAYRDIPMDMADASLVAASESLSTSRIFTIDSHFYAYRTVNGQPLEIIA